MTVELCRQPLSCAANAMRHLSVSTLAQLITIDWARYASVNYSTSTTSRPRGGIDCADCPGGSTI